MPLGMTSSSIAAAAIITPAITSVIALQCTSR
jgi:hypothetical protein